jgi:hypothetical protein
MPRSVRIEYPEVFYHGIASGNRCGKIFADDDDRRFELMFFRVRDEWQVYNFRFSDQIYRVFSDTP